MCTPCPITPPPEEEEVDQPTPPLLCRKRAFVLTAHPISLALSREGRVKLTDFGLARDVNDLDKVREIEWTR